MVEANKNHPNMQNKTLFQVMSDYDNSQNKIHMVEAIQNRHKIIKHITPSDVRLLAFRNKISIVEADQNHHKITKHITSSDARQQAFRNKLYGGGWSKPKQIIKNIT